ncbi:AAA family ATPase [Sulfurimonas sp.]
MIDNFLKTIEIKQYKCFKDLEVDNLKRVNLIGGKNNIGKTAFLEACYLLSNSFNIFKSDPNYKSNTGSQLNRDWFHFEIIKLLISIKQNRDTTNFLLEWLLEEFELNDIVSFQIMINTKFRLTLDNDVLIPEHFGTQAWGNWGIFNISKFRDSSYYNKIYKKNHKPQLDNYTFSSICNIENIKDMIDELKLNEKYNLLNQYLQEIFQVEQVDIIKNKIMLKQYGTFKSLNEFGDGIKHFINILVIMFSHKNTTIYLDEIENGIHFENIDKLWEIIFKVSKEQNIQVFATTHSRECINSYSKISEQLQENNISFINLSKNEKNEIVVVVLDNDMFHSEIEQNHEVRAW